MAERFNDGAQQTSASQPSQTANPVADAQMSSTSITPADIHKALHHTLAAQVMVQLTYGQMQQMEAAAGQLGPRQPQNISNNPLNPAAQYQILQSLPVIPTAAYHVATAPTPAVTATPYQPFSSSAQPSQNTPAAPSTSTQAAISSAMASTATTSGAAPIQSNPPNSQSGFFATPTSNSTAANTSAINTAVASPASAQPSSQPFIATPQSTPAHTSTQQQPLISGLLAPSNTNLNSGSFANHIQNVLSAVIGSAPAQASQQMPALEAARTSQTIQILPTNLHSPISANPVISNEAPQKLSSNRDPAHQEMQMRDQLPSKDASARGEISSALPAINPSLAVTPEPAQRSTIAPPANTPDLEPRTSAPVAPQQPAVNPNPNEVNLQPAPQPTYFVPQQPTAQPQPYPTEKQQNPPAHSAPELTVLPYTPKPDPISTPGVDQQQQRQQDQQQQQQSIDRLRDIQQILATELDLPRPIPARSLTDTAIPSPDRRENTNVVLERARESVLDQLTSLQSRIDTTAAERQRVQELTGPIDRRIQGRENLVRPDPIYHDSKPSLITRLAERLQENQSPTRVMREPLVGLTGASVAERTRARQASPTSPPHEYSANSRSQPLERATHSSDRITNLIDILKRFSQRSIDFKLLRSMDTSLEKACLTVATGVALGYVGMELLYRATNLVVLQTLGLLREKELDSSDSDDKPQETALEKQLEGELEDLTASELSTFGEQGFVVDLAGVVLLASTEFPLADVVVHCSEFGTCITDDAGRFLFPNIPLGTPYTISVSSSTHNLKPMVITGICGELEFLRIKVS
jgi:hypothetical protein